MGLEDQRVVAAPDKAVPLVATRSSMRLDQPGERLELVGDVIELGNRGVAVQGPGQDPPYRGRGAPGGYDIGWEIVVGADPKGRMWGRGLVRRQSGTDSKLTPRHTILERTNEQKQEHPWASR